MTLFAESVGLVAPYYNLVLVCVVLLLFLKLFSMPANKTFLTPWKIVFATIVIFIIEELLTVFTQSGIFATPRALNAVFEFAIVTLFIYALLLQKDYLKNVSGRGVSPSVSTKKTENKRKNA